MKQVKVLLIKNECYGSDGSQANLPLTSTLDNHGAKYRFPTIKEVQHSIDFFRTIPNPVQVHRNSIIKYEEYLEEFA